MTAPNRIWLWLSANGNIRKWQGEPFNEGCEYVRVDSLQEPAFDGDVAKLVERLRHKADMIHMGEKIAWGTDTAAMREAADTIEDMNARLTAFADALIDQCNQRNELIGRAERAEARLAECEAALRRAPGALHGMFAAGAEECEGGSARRQETHMRPAEALKEEIRAYFASAEGGRE